MSCTKASLPEHSIMVGNIIARYAATTPAQRRAGHAWYPNARRFAVQLAKETGLTVAQTSGVIAAMSPQKEWELNKRMARTVCMAHALGKPLPQLQTTPQMAKAAAIVAAPVRTFPAIAAYLSGPKESAFMRGIMGNRSVPTIDRWAYMTATGLHIGEGGIPVHVYGPLADAFIHAAQLLGINVVALQAIVWIAERELNAALKAAARDAARAAKAEAKRVAKVAAQYARERAREEARILRDWARVTATLHA